MTELFDVTDKRDTQGERLGLVVSGSLSKGVRARLDHDASVEDMAVGRYVVVQGHKKRFFGMITDVALETSNQEVLNAPPSEEGLIAEIMSGTSAYGCLDVMPMLTLSNDPAEAMLGPQPVKTVPSHFAPVSTASKDDVNAVFGQEDGGHFYVGTPLDMDVKVCLNLRRFVERSSGVFGKSGTGKTFLTRLLLAGLVYNDAAVNLVFDMHNEYGYKGTSEEKGQTEVKALKQLFNAQVVVCTLDPESSRARGSHADFQVEIGYDQVEPQDVAMLQEVLGLSDAAIESVQRLGKIFGDARWLEEFLAVDTGGDLDEFATSHGLNPSTVQVIRRKFDSRLLRLGFLKPKAVDKTMDRIIETLTSGKHVVLEFGRHSTLDAYMLVANILTRRIHERYVQLKETALGTGGAGPKPLVITIEEAHKFLSPKVAEYTIFGTIAREMRKYNVTLLVVDQRPSSIADEVMSQIGTRITCLLDDEKDITAVLSGVSNAQALRSVLAKLDSKQQALILGHAVPMPVVIRTRKYGTPEFYNSMKGGSAVAKDVNVGELFGDFGE